MKFNEQGHLPCGCGNYYDYKNVYPNPDGPESIPIIPNYATSNIMI